MTHNVYEALGRPDADQLNARAELTARVYLAIERRGISRDAAAELLDVERARLDALLQGDFDEFTMPMLVDYLNRLGHDIELVVKPASSDGAGKTSISAA